MEELHLLQSVKSEKMLVSIGVQDQTLEVVEILGTETAGDAGFEAEKAEDHGEGDISGDEFFDGVVLG